MVVSDKCGITRVMFLEIYIGNICTGKLPTYEQLRKLTKISVRCPLKTRLMESVGSACAGVMLKIHQ